MLFTHTNTEILQCYVLALFLLWAQLVMLRGGFSCTDTCCLESRSLLRVALEAQQFSFQWGRELLARAELCHSRTRGAEVLPPLFGIFKSFKLFFPLSNTLQIIYLKENLKCAILQTLGSLFASFFCGRSVNVSDYSYKLLVQVKLVFAFVVSSPSWYVLIWFSQNFLLFAAL